MINNIVGLTDIREENESWFSVKSCKTETKVITSRYSKQPNEPIRTSNWLRMWRVIFNNKTDKTENKTRANTLIGTLHFVSIQMGFLTT